jgi:hypothetical protein
LPLPSAERLAFPRAEKRVRGYASTAGIACRKKWTYGKASQMQYIGYLRRNANELPDSSFDGFEFWLKKLNQFNGNFIEAEMVRAFIESGEYRARFGP